MLFIRTLFYQIIYGFVGLIPRNKKVWVFGSGGGSFSGNSKALFLNSYNPSKIRKIWLSRDKKIVGTLQSNGYEAYVFPSWKGVFYAIRAGVYVFNISSLWDLNYFLSNGAKKVNLWHGIPVKKGGSDTDLKDNYFYKVHRGTFWQRLSYRFFSPWESEMNDLVIATSEKTQSLMRGVFGPRAKEIAVTGYPHNDLIFGNFPIFFEDEKEVVEAFQKLKSQGQKIVLYMPTYRDGKIVNAQGIDLAMHWNELDLFLKKNKSVLFLKLHPIDKTNYDFLKPYDNIQLIHPRVDVYSGFRYVDLLITDYSSVFYDFVLTDKPVIFYCYDLEEYKVKHRSLYEDFFVSIPGPLVQTFDSLLPTLDQYLNPSMNLVKEYSEKIKTCKRLTHQYVDSNSSERVYKALIDICRLN